MPYEGQDNLNQLSVGTPLNGASPAELAAAIRELKMVFKNVLLTSMLPNGGLRGITVDTLAAGCVGTEQLIDRAVTSSKIGLAAILTELIADGQITSVKIADGAVTFGKLAAESIGGDAFRDNTIPLTALADALTGAYIQSHSTDDTQRAINSNHIKDNAVIDRIIAGMALTKLIGGSEGQILAKGASGWTAVTPAGGLTYNPTTGLFSVTSPATVAHFGDRKSPGSHGGGSTANTWITRDLGEIEDGRGLMSFTGNLFKLTVGSYFFYAKVPACGAVGKHQARLHHTAPDASVSVKLWGSSEQCAASVSNSSIIQGTFDVTDADEVFKIEHWLENTVATSGLGLATNSLSDTAGSASRTEVYTEGYILKLAD